MTEFALSSWLWWLALAVAASLAGVMLARRMPWMDAAWRVNVPTAFGLALAPFLFGFAGVLVLGVLPGASIALHRVAALLLLLALGLAAWGFRRSTISQSSLASQDSRFGGVAWVLLSLPLVIWIVYLLVESLLFPLVTNDALEYATVGRLLFETGSLLEYPAIQPERGSSGFFGPWTHPPLYTAAVYLSYAAQGHADMPGLMRLIAPWFFLTSAWLLRSLGNVASRLTGLLACLMFVSTPLAIIGASTSMIDALPMSGLTLILTTVVLLQGRPGRLSVVRGLVLGLALWTHSQSVLFLPLTFVALVSVDGWSQVRARTKQLCVVAGIACVVAAWPYLRNVKIFGSLVSDNPAVFAMPQLHWDEYFAKARGLEHWPERIQYGIFKGWFALESFGLTFWFASLGLCFLVQAYRRSHERSLSGGVPGAKARLSFAVSVILMTYLGGVTLSTVLGIDLMIKNDRYLLVMLPCAALLAGMGLERWLGSVSWIDPAAGRWRDQLRSISVILIVAALVLPSLAAVAYQNYIRQTFGLELTSLLYDSHQAKLKPWHGYRAARFIGEQTPSNAIVLAERPADMYYSGRRMVSYLDPRLVPAYQERDPQEMIRQLNQLGITHLQFPGYSIPVIYNTAAQTIAARPDLSTLVYSSGMEQVYTLKPSPGRLGSAIDIGPGAVPWVQSKRFSLFGISVVIAKEQIAPERSDSGFSFPVLQRTVSSMLLSGVKSQHGEDQDLADLLPVQSAREYLVELELDGNAYAYVYLFQYDAFGRKLGRGRVSSELLSDVPLSAESGSRLVARRVALSPQAAYIRIGVEHRGNSWVSVLKGRLTIIVGDGFIQPPRVRTTDAPATYRVGGGGRE
jgi:hypothetical protein